MVGGGVPEVDLLVCDVEVSAGHNGLMCVKLEQEEAEALIPAHTLFDAREALLGVGRVDVHEPERGKLKGTDAPLVIRNVTPDLADDPQGILAREHRRARVALALGKVPGLEVSGQVKLDLSLLQLGLLDGEHVGVQLGEDLQEAGVLPHDGAKAVDVPRDELERPVGRDGVSHGMRFLSIGRCSHEGSRATRGPRAPRTRGTGTPLCAGSHAAPVPHPAGRRPPAGCCPAWCS